MSSSLLSIFAKDSHDNFIAETSFFDIRSLESSGGRRPKFSLIEFPIVNTPTHTDLVLDFVSDAKKFYVQVNNSFYHFVQETMSNVVWFLERYEDGIVILNTDMVFESLETNTSDTNFVLESLDALTKTYGPDRVFVINFLKFDELRINNYYASGTIDSVSDRSLISNKFYTDYFGIKDLNPERKVYLSRRHLATNGQTPSVVVDSISSMHMANGNRIDNDHQLEEFFKSIGFEIIIPEEFKSFSEQIQFFRSVKVLASLTSSGLTNSIFMQSGQTVIELVTPLVIWTSLESFRQEIHHFYKTIAYEKQHTHISIPNIDKRASALIDKLLSSDSIKYINGSETKGRRWLRRR